MNQMRIYIWSILAIFGLALSCAALGTGNGTGDWLQRRALDFKAWQRAHPHADAEIARLKAKTASEVKAYLARATPAETSAGASPVIWRVKGAITEIIDCKDCPEMMVDSGRCIYDGLTHYRRGARQVRRAPASSDDGVPLCSEQVRRNPDRVCSILSQPPATTRKPSASAGTRRTRMTKVR